MADEQMDPQTVASIPLLAVLKPRAREQVLRTARRQLYQPGEVVVSEGDPATRLFIIATGSARVEKSGKAIGLMQAGDFFGELALLEQHGRTATVIADSDLTCLIIAAWEFRASLDEHPEMAVPMLEAVIRRLHAQEGRGA
ncbi:MAG: cyclic nucleotide-binding domain-containing protein [Chloroflexota bacterium]